MDGGLGGVIEQLEREEEAEVIGSNTHFSDLHHIFDTLFCIGMIFNLSRIDRVI